MGLIFVLFDVASSLDVPFGTPQYVQYILHGLTRALLCSLTTKSIDFVVGLGFNESSIIFKDLDLAIHNKYSLPSYVEPVEILQHHLY